ncbi:MAG: calcium-binding protein, partial [Oscillatoriaceae cyanobacterium Prado104]|nr:calcium-binding protein [Oscillatoriaceae cyanobacterium Prado104]
MSSNNPAEGTVSTNSITFTNTNWNVPQPITVTGVNDSITDGDVDYKIITANTVSGDPNYSDKDVADVSLTNKDNDTAGVIVTPTEITATEGGANGSYTVVLKSQPTGDVTVNLTTGSQIEPIAPLTFTAADWNIAKTVTVKAVDDAIVEG